MCSHLPLTASHFYTGSRRPHPPVASWTSAWQVWASVERCGQVRTGVVRCGQLWSGVGSCGQLWAGVGKCEPVWQELKGVGMALVRSGCRMRSMTFFLPLVAQSYPFPQSPLTLSDLDTHWIPCVYPLSLIPQPCLQAAWSASTMEDDLLELSSRMVRLFIVRAARFNLYIAFRMWLVVARCEV